MCQRAKGLMQNDFPDDANAVPLGATASESQAEAMGHAPGDVPAGAAPMHNGAAPQASHPAGEPSQWKERRAARRLALQLPVFVTVDDGTLKDYATQTRDVSASGVFFEMDSPLVVGTEIEFTLTLPPEITHGDAIRVHCVGTVVRSEVGERGGVAAIIDEFDLVT